MRAEELEEPYMLKENPARDKDHLSPQHGSL